MEDDEELSELEEDIPLDPGLVQGRKIDPRDWNPFLADKGNDMKEALQGFEVQKPASQDSKYFPASSRNELALRLFANVINKMQGFSSPAGMHLLFNQKTKCKFSATSTLDFDQT